jgi:hypothetical protein
VVLAAVAGTLLVVETQLNVNADTNSTSTVTSDSSSTTTNTDTAIANDNSTQTGFEGGFRHGRGGGFMNEQQGCGNSGLGGSQIQVSDEFKANVTSIASSDSDVQNLLNNGYNVTSVIPQYQSIVDGNGNVTTKASTAILILTKEDTNSTGKAAVFVDLTEAKVTKIYTETRTLIEK